MTLRQIVEDFVDKTIELPSRMDEFHIEPRCRVCRDDKVRKQVNDLLASGASYAMVLRSLEQDEASRLDDHCVTLDSIRNHSVRHFPVQQVARATYREIVERRAREAQIDFVNGVSTALTPMAMYECVMNEAFRKLSTGRADISIDTGLRAAQKLQTLTDARAEHADMAAVLADMGRIIDVVRTFIPAQRWPEVQAALRGDASVQPRQSTPGPNVRMVTISDNSEEQDS